MTSAPAAVVSGGKGEQQPERTLRADRERVHDHDRDARQSDAPRRAADDRAEVAGRRESAHAALGESAVGEREIGGTATGLGRGMVRATAEQREQDVLALVQEPEGGHARGWRVVGHEQDRLQRTASS